MQSNSRGVDGTSLKGTKSVQSVIVPISCQLINKSVGKGIFPEALMVARTIPSHKEGKRNDSSNRRPIQFHLLLLEYMDR